MILNVILIVILLKLSRCSLVLDSMSQNTLYVSNYCPAMKNCIEGSHVICQYYDHHQTEGSLCNNYVKISITPQMVQQILEGVNNIRMKLATGEETGKDSQLLPRAYGMMRMHWDSELATLAQVLADQCLGLKEDNCRATDQFSNPSQIITLINFKAPHWEYLTGNSTKRGLNKEKVSSSIDKALRSLHGIKRLITPNDINNCPELEELSDKGSRSYLKLIRGKATHIGCGISAYTRSQILSSGLQHTYNSVQLVCNVSDGPQRSKPVYTTDPPIPDTGFTEKCGCPEGYRDSIGCLCERDTHGNIENSEIRHIDLDKIYDGRGQNQPHESGPCADPNEVCDGEPNMVVLPIFDIQDAPNGSYEPANEIEMEFHQAFGNTSFFQTSVEGNENKNQDNVIYPETENGFLRKHLNDIRKTENRRAISDEQRERELISHDKVGISVERSAENYDNAYSMHKNIVEHNPRQISDYGDKMATSDYQEDQQEDDSFLSILNHLERAVKKIKLEDDEKDIFDFKMRRIYEAALKSKVQHESDELEDEFRKLTDYLKHKSDAALVDKSVQSDKEDEYDYLNRRENDCDEFGNGIDEKLIKILSKKLHHKDDYFSKIGDKNSRHDENDAYYNFPVTRKQEKIDKYDIIESKEEKRGINIRNLKKLRSPATKSHYGMRKISDKIKKNKLNEMRKIQTNIKKDKAIKTFGRRTFSYPKHKVSKAPKSPGYRRIFETENERPTLPTTQKYEKIKVEIHKNKYLKKNRPIL